MKNRIKKYFIGFINWIDNLLDTWTHKPQPEAQQSIYATI